MATAPQPMPQMFPQLLSIPMVYFNGFNIALTNSEISTLLLHDGQPAIKTAMPLSTAKSLMIALQTLIEKYESATKTKVLSNDELVELLSAMEK